jgi:integrase
MATNTRQSSLGLIWRLLEGTGCRGAEIAGLRVEDVQLDVLYPHIRVRWHEDRRVKTRVSIRSVPLVGGALEAAKEAVKIADGSRMVFDRYAHAGGPDAVSQALMKHLRKFTENPLHVVYSLRHNMKDYLVTAGVPERDEHRILGHSLGGVGNRVYGGDNAKLKAATDAMTKALALAP